MTKQLDRETFRTSREMDFFSEKELVTQTGHGIDEWPLVFLKETIDNALDACEESDTAPRIEVIATATDITVTDNGSGIPESTIEGALDFSVRASSREMYVAPDHGAQGNALMTLLAMPYVIDPEAGKLTISANGFTHDLVCRADPITQRPVINHDRIQCNGHGGTSVSIQWSDQTEGDVFWPFDDVDPTEEGDEYYPTLRDRASDLLRGYAVFNPHLTLTVQWFDEHFEFKATAPDWTKWKPNRPTSPHWYERRHLERLIAAYISLDQESGTDRTVAAFLSEFDGLTGSRKRKMVLEETGLSRVPLSNLASDDGLDSETIAKLLDAMKQNTNPVKAPRLGVIGKEHMATRLRDLGCEPEHIDYKKITRLEDGVPYVLESACGWLGDDAPECRHIYAGANWSPGINNPFRSFGATGEGLDAQLRELRAGASEPIVFVLHLAHPRVEYADRGKSAIVV